jgi:hypothetical protein
MPPTAHNVATDSDIRLLAAAQRRGELEYPLARTPASCRLDGQLLLRAIDEGDHATINRLGIRARR